MEDADVRNEIGLGAREDAERQLGCPLSRALSIALSVNTYYSIPTSGRALKLAIRMAVDVVDFYNRSVCQVGSLRPVAQEPY